MELEAEEDLYEDERLDMLVVSSLFVSESLYRSSLIPSLSPSRVFS